MDVKSFIELFNPKADAEIAALSDFLLSGSYQERFPRQLFFNNAFKALSFNEISGDYVEFGCNGATTFRMAFCESRRHGHVRKLWAYDSFQGLPDQRSVKDSHPKWKQGTMSMDQAKFEAICQASGMTEADYFVVPGFYEDTLTNKELPAPDDICLAYIDCDLYSSTMTALEFLMPRLKHGMIIAFDDYYCWSEQSIAGERQAALEVFGNQSRWHLLPYMKSTWAGMSFIVEDRNLTGGIPLAVGSHFPG